MEYDADFHKERIFGAHVQEYMETMKDEDEQGYQKLYSGSPGSFFLHLLTMISYLPRSLSRSAGYLYFL